MNYFPFHIGDYAAGAGGLSFVDHGAYLLMLMQYYKREKPLPKKVEEICYMVGASSTHHKKAVARVLKRFFVEGQDGYRQERADAAIAAYKQRVARNTENSRRRTSSETDVAPQLTVPSDQGSDFHSPQ
jgi:uncharacterized protein YdaU (DUF1376 family)